MITPTSQSNGTLLPVQGSPLVPAAPWKPPGFAECPVVDKPHFKTPGTSNCGCAASSNGGCGCGTSGNPEPKTPIPSFLQAVDSNQIALSGGPLANSVPSAMRIPLLFALQTQTTAEGVLETMARSGWDCCITIGQEKKKECCCPKELKLEPPSGTTGETPLVGGGSLHDTWGAVIQAGLDRNPKYQAYSDKKKDEEVQYQRDQHYGGGSAHGGGDGLLGETEIDGKVYFKFQVIGIEDWREGPKGPCRFEQDAARDGPAGKVKRRPDVGSGNTDRNSTDRSKGGVNRRIDGSTQSYEDPTMTHNEPKGVTTREFWIKFIGNNCPCDPNELKVEATLVIDTRDAPANKGNKWSWKKV